MPKFRITSKDARVSLLATNYSERWPLVHEYIDECLNQEGEEYFTSMESLQELYTDFHNYWEVADEMAS